MGDWILGTVRHVITVWKGGHTMILPTARIARIMFTFITAQTFITARITFTFICITRFRGIFSIYHLQVLRHKLLVDVSRAESEDIPTLNFIVKNASL